MVGGENERKTEPITSPQGHFLLSEVWQAQIGKAQDRTHLASPHVSSSLPRFMSRRSSSVVVCDLCVCAGCPLSIQWSSL